MAAVTEPLDLAGWIVRLNAKGEASTRGGDLRRLALVTCAKGAAEVQLYRQQRARQMTGSKRGAPKKALKRLHSESFCVCDACTLCSGYQASGASSCYCRALGYVTNSSPTAVAPPSTTSSIQQQPSSLLSDDEESKLIDDFLTSLNGVPSKKCKRL